MGFADVTLAIRQMSGETYPRLEMGCFSADASSVDIPTRLTHVVGGLLFACVTGGGVIGRPCIGSVCDGGFVGFTVCGDPDQICPYFVAGW